MDIQNARIGSADINFDRGFILSAWLHLEFEGCGQGFGGYVLGGKPDTTCACNDHPNQPNLAADFIGHCMAIADVEQWSKMAGKIIRVKRADKYGKILAIGHAVKDLWYEPEHSETFKAAREAV